MRWLNVTWAAGTPRPAKCIACGQDAGVIDAHAEDYSLPFALGKTDEFHLCFTCHMMVHCRFKNPHAWDRYGAIVMDGGYYLPFLTRNFPVFAQRHLPRQDSMISGDQLRGFTFGQPPARNVLGEIDGWLVAHGRPDWRLR
jgi:hypothetical protein